MRSLLVAVGAAVAVFVALALLTRPLYAVVPAAIVLVAAYIVIARRMGKKVELALLDVQREIEQQRIENALAQLRAAYAHTPWVFLLKAQLDGQVGSLLYVQKKYDEAAPLLDAAWPRHWVAKGMLASHWFRKHKPDDAMKVLDKAIATSAKEPLLYALKAYMRTKLKDRDGALAAMVAGKAKCPSSVPLAENLIRLQNGEEMRMYEFGEGWWQFGLERPGQKDIQRMTGVAPGAAFGSRKQQVR